MVNTNRIAARYEARTAAFRKRLEAKRAEKKLREEDEGIIEVDGVKLNAAETEVIFADEDKDIQVVASPNPENENEVVVAVLTASKDDVEEEEVLGSASVEGSEETAGAEEARKAERREAFRKRLEAKRAEGKSATPARNEARIAAFRKRLEARRAGKTSESKVTATADARKKSIAEARAKFRSKIGKKA